MTYNTIKEATQAWIGRFNAIPQGLIEKAYFENHNYEDFAEITPIEYCCNDCGFEGFKDDFNIKMGGKVLRCPECQNVDCIDEKDRYYDLPIWGWLWTFESSLDEEWARENLELVAKCGFRIYESDELGIVLGIDGAGYDFYEAHWIPLYKARGLKWHKDVI